ncbi:MAG: hypothetical protein H7Z14_12530, partial [Anaerolineae bacterium]|nr:hypothetical protein [Phycisphaerae bacterium]
MNASLLLAMLLVLTTWAALVVVLVGIGLGVQGLFGLRTINTSTLLLSPWNGFAIVILFLQTWHFVFAIRWPAIAVVAVLGALGLWSARHELMTWFRSVRIGWPLGFALALAAIWVANRAIAPGNAFDSGLYHYAVVRWSHEHPIQIGLANLHTQYGFNNSCHLFVAMLQVGPWDGRANHIANSLLLYIWFATVAISAARLLRGTGSGAQNLFQLVLLIPLVMYSVTKEPSSPTTDLPQAAVAFAAASAFMRLLADDSDEDTGQVTGADRALTSTSVALLGATALCIKLTAASTVAPMGLLAIAVYLYRKPPAKWARTTLLWTFGLSGALAITWTGRGLLLSGCPFYPSRFLSPPVEWRVLSSVWPGLDPLLRIGGETVRVDMLLRAVTTNDGRVPGWLAAPIRAALENSNHTVQWLIALVFASTIEVALPVLLALLGAVALLRRKVLGKSSSATVRLSEWLICIPPLIGFVVWFIVSPEPRYIASSLWMLAAAIMSMTFRETRHPVRLVACVTALAILPIAYRMVILKFNPESGPIRQAVFIPAGPDYGFHPIPVVEMRQVRLKWGLIVNMPKNTGTCWDAALPATPSLNPRLTLRIPGELES